MVEGDMPVLLNKGEFEHVEGATFPDEFFSGVDAKIYNGRDIFADKAVLYIYPATGKLGIDPGPNWDAIPGAAGCTVQSLGFLEYHQDFLDLGYKVFGLSAQPVDDQLEFQKRMNIPFMLLNDSKFILEKKLYFPTFLSGEKKFYKRAAIIVEFNRIVKVFYPVVPSQESARNALTWLRLRCNANSDRLK